MQDSNNPPNPFKLCSELGKDKTVRTEVLLQNPHLNLHPTNACPPPYSYENQVFFQEMANRLNSSPTLDILVFDILIFW